jgi:hypothetical protein
MRSKPELINSSVSNAVVRVRSSQEQLARVWSLDATPTQRHDVNVNCEPLKQSWVQSVAEPLNKRLRPALTGPLGKPQVFPIRP